MGVLSAAYIAAFLGPGGNGTNADGTPYRPKPADAAALGAAVDNAIPNAQDLRAVQNSVTAVQTGLTAVSARTDAVTTTANGATTLAQTAQKSVSNLAAVVDTKVDQSALDALQAVVAGKIDAASSATLADVASVQSRPGEAYRLWTSQVEGDPGTMAPLPASWIVTDTDGAVARIPGAGVVGPMTAYKVEPNRLYQVRFAFRRRVNSSDPANDDVRLALRLLGTGKGALPGATSLVADITGLTVAQGRQQVVGYAAIGTTGPNWTPTPPTGSAPPGQAWLTSAGSYLTDANGDYIFAPDGSGLVILPVGTAYLRPFAQAFGDTAYTDIEIVEWSDITFGNFVAPSTTIFESRMEALEGVAAGTRLATLESQMATPQAGTYLTAAEIPATTIPVTVKAFRTLFPTPLANFAAADWVRSPVQPNTPNRLQSADGAWWLLASSGVTLAMFGLVPFDPTSAAANGAALQAAVNALPYGGILQIPRASTYYLSGDPIVVPDGVSIVGDDPFASVFVTTSATGLLFDLGNGCSLERLKITSSVPRTGDPYCRILANGAKLVDCEFAGYYQIVQIGDDTHMAVRPSVINCGGSNPAGGAGSGGILGLNVSNLTVDRNVLAGPPKGQVQPDWGIRIIRCDTVLLTSNNVTLHGAALLLDPPAGYNLFGVASTGNFWDSAGVISNGAPAPSAQITPRGGGVYNAKFCNDWFGLSEADGLLVTTYGGGAVDGLQLTGCEAPGNAQIGMHFAGPGLRNINVTGGQAAGNGSHGLSFGGFVLFTVIGVGTGDASGRGKNGGYGLYIDAGCDNYQIVGNDLSNNTLLPGCNDPSNSQTRIFRDNLGILDVNQGAALVTFDSTGMGAVEHGLQGTPQWASVNVLFVTNGERAAVYQLSATEITVRLARSTDNSPVSGPFEILWEARL